MLIKYVGIGHRIIGKYKWECNQTASIGEEDTPLVLRQRNMEICKHEPLLQVFTLEQLETLVTIYKVSTPRSIQGLSKEARAEAAKFFGLNVKELNALIDKTKKVSNQPPAPESVAAPKTSG